MSALTGQARTARAPPRGSQPYIRVVQGGGSVVSVADSSELDRYASFSVVTTLAADYRQTSIAPTFGSQVTEAYRVHFLQVLPWQYERAVAQAIGYLLHDLYLTVRLSGWVY